MLKHRYPFFYHFLLFLSYAFVCPFRMKWIYSVFLCHIHFMTLATRTCRSFRLAIFPQYSSSSFVVFTFFPVNSVNILFKNTHTCAMHVYGGSTKFLLIVRLLCWMLPPLPWCWSYFCSAGTSDATAMDSK